MSALPSTNVDEEEVEYTTQLELIETIQQEEVASPEGATRIRGSITVSF